jgi:hypothetical protein
MKTQFSFVAFSNQLLEVIHSLLDVKDKVTWTWGSPVKVIDWIFFWLLRWIIEPDTNITLIK